MSCIKPRVGLQTAGAILKRFPKPHIAATRGLLVAVAGTLSAVCPESLSMVL